MATRFQDWRAFFSVVAVAGACEEKPKASWQNHSSSKISLSIWQGHISWFSIPCLELIIFSYIKANKLGFSF